MVMNFATLKDRLLHTPLVAAALLVSSPTQAQEQVALFSIPPSTLSQALMTFGVQSGYVIAFPEAIADGLSTGPLEGQMTAEDALGELLDGTNLTYEMTGDRVVRIAQTQPQSSAPVPVQADDFSQMAAPNFVDEILVTATKRPQPLQEVPIAVTAFDAATLEAGRLENLVDITRLAPGITGSTFNQSSPIYAVRGATNTFSSAGASKPVGVFIDDVFIPRYSAADFDLFDLEQVAILRGPQGTLFGRNVTGGAIQLTTAKPSTEALTAKLKVSAGNLDFLNVSGLLNAPLSDTAAAKLSINYKDREGYIEDRFNGREFNDIGTVSLRGQVLVQARDSLEFILSGDYTRDDNHSRGYSFVSSSNGDASGNDGNIRTAELDVPQNFDRDIYGVSLTANWDLDAGTATSISAYRYSDSTELYSLSPGAPPPLTATFAQQIQEDSEQPKLFSQELRFVSNPGPRFDYVAGAYVYLSDTNRTQNNTRRGFLTRDLLFETDADTSSFALYGDVVVHLFDGALDISGGGRWTREKNEITFSTQDRLNPARDFLVSGSDTYSEFTSRVAITWNATENMNVYASRTEGFTAGGFNSEVDNPAIIDQVFGPETVTMYELGVKSQWLDDRLTLNVAAFDQTFRDKQEGFFNPSIFIFSIFNAAKASTQGIEVEGSFTHESGFRASVNYAYLDATYDSFVIPNGADFSGNKLSTSPEHTFSVFADYSTPINEWGNLVLTASYSYQDAYFTGASNSPNFLIDGYGLINGSIGFESADGRYKLSVWGNNLADKEFVLIRGTSFSIGEYYGPPRTYGATLTYQFN